MSRVKHVLDRNQLVTVINALFFNNEMTVLFYRVVKHIEQKYLKTTCTVSAELCRENYFRNQEWLHNPRIKLNICSSGTLSWLQGV